MRGGRSRIARAARAEDGGASALGLLCLLLMAMLLGLAIDVASLYRQQALLRLAADASAHAGAVALARGADAAEAQREAAVMLARNLPPARFGRLVADPALDLRALYLDPAAGALAPPEADRPANTLLVRLQRSEAVRNPLPTHVLRLFGIDSWTTGTASVATVQATQRCGNAGGLFARGPIDLGTTGSRIEGALCLHSQTGLSLGGATADGLRISLPDLGACDGDCGGHAASRVAMNLVMPDTAGHVGRLAAGFLREGPDIPERAAFFATRPIAEDLEPLAEVGIDTGELVTGSIVRLSAMRFSLMRAIPAGLVYRVTCDRPAEEIPPESPDFIRLAGDEAGVRLRDAVLVTNCPLGLDARMRVEGALVILLHPASAVIDAAPGARMGDPAGVCSDRRRSVLMTAGDIVLPPTLATSNLALVAGGDVVLPGVAGAEDGPGQGFSVHAGGSITARGPLWLAACEGAADPVLPSLRVIAHTLPSLAGWVTPLLPPRPATDMPGTAVKPLPLAEPRHGEG